MGTHRKGALLAFVVSILFIALQVCFDVQTGLAGLFVAGMAGGLLIGGEMARDAKHPDEKAAE
jgi:hypothetical protein